MERVHEWVSERTKKWNKAQVDGMRKQEQTGKKPEHSDDDRANKIEWDWKKSVKS